jgi:hypothetical protein
VTSRETNAINCHGHLFGLLQTHKKSIQFVNCCIAPASLSIREEDDDKLRSLSSFLGDRLLDGVKTWEEIGSTANSGLLDVLHVLSFCVGCLKMSVRLEENCVDSLESIRSFIFAKDLFPKVKTSLLEGFERRAAHRSTLIVEKHQILSIIGDHSLLIGAQDFIDLFLAHCGLNLNIDYGFVIWSAVLWVSLAV